MVTKNIYSIRKKYKRTFERKNDRKMELYRYVNYFDTFD